eukprot:153497_1
MDTIELNMVSGWMEKKSRYLKAWRKRWICFNGLDILTFAKKQNIGGYHKNSKYIYYSLHVESKATEIIHLIHIKHNAFKVNNYRNMFSFILFEGKNEREISFRCSSTKAFVKWIQIIQNTMDMARNKYMIAKIISLNSYYYYNVKKYIYTNNIILEKIELVISFEIRHNINVKKFYIPYDIIVLCCCYYSENKQRLIENIVTEER